MKVKKAKSRWVTYEFLSTYNGRSTVRCEEHNPGWEFIRASAFRSKHACERCKVNRVMVKLGLSR